MDGGLIVTIVVIAVVFILLVVAWEIFILKKRSKKNYARAFKMVTLLIHLPPSTDDVQVGGRDERDVVGEQLSAAQVMYSIIASTVTKGLNARIYGQKHISFEIVAHDGFVKYFAVVPSDLVEMIKQAVTAAYPTARLEQTESENIFSEVGGINAVAGGELCLKEPFWYPIATYEDSKRDASLALINALSSAKKGESIAVQILIRPTDGNWVNKSVERVQKIKEGKKASGTANMIGRFSSGAANMVSDVAEALWKPPDEHEKWENTQDKPLSNLEQEEIQKIEEKTKYPGFETLVRIIASSENRPRTDMLLNNVVSVFSQFDLPQYNGFKYDFLNKSDDLSRNYILRWFPQKSSSMVLNSMELASLFHLPSQNAIPTSQVERQSTKQVDGPAKLAEDGIILGVNEFRGEKKIIRLRENDRRRHTYAIGATGSGKSVLLENLAYQDMCDGRGFAFIDPHGDAVEWLLSRVPEERMDDVILFEPGNLENPVGMNMFEFQTEDQKDFIIQESLNMLISLYDPGNQGIFGPRAQHMFRNAALLLMSDPAGGTFIDIPRCFIDAEFVKSKLKYVKDKTVYDYWTKEFPASQKSSEAGDVTSWFVSKWGPFLSNKMMRNILGQTKSGFDIRQIMDNKKILLVNLSKGTTGELNAKLLGMIFVMKFQAAAMSRADIKNVDDRVDFCLFVDEFQNFATESFESILSEARKYRLNLVLANQFMTQLTDKIREAVIGNVGTIMCGRIGVTDAELMEKAFTPVFTALDLHNQPNYNWIATVMMFDTPTSPFTLKTLPPMGEDNPELMERMKAYALSRHGRPRAEVEKEIEARLATTPAKKSEPAAGAAGATTGDAAEQKKSSKEEFLNSWLKKSADAKEKSKDDAHKALDEKKGIASAPTTPAANSAIPSVKPIGAPTPAPTVGAASAPAASVPAPAATAPVSAPIESPAIGETVWDTAVAENIKEAAPESVAMVADKVEDDDSFASGVKIRHQNNIASVEKPASAPAPASPAADTQNIATSNTTQGTPQEEDGVVLRWR